MSVATIFKTIGSDNRTMSEWTSRDGHAIVTVYIPHCKTHTSVYHTATNAEKKESNSKNLLPWYL